MKRIIGTPYYKLFKKMWLERFKGYYKRGRINKDKLKENVFNARYLSDEEKSDFWRLVSGE